MRVGWATSVPPATISRAIVTGKVSRARDLIASSACDCWGVPLHVASGIARGWAPGRHSVQLMGVYPMGMYFTDARPVSTYLINVHLMGVHLTGCAVISATEARLV